MACWQGSDTAHTLSFVDLAGSERVGRTGNTGHRLKCAAVLTISACVLQYIADAAYAASCLPARDSSLSMEALASLLARHSVCCTSDEATPLDAYRLERQSKYTCMQRIA